MMNIRACFALSLLLLSTSACSSATQPRNEVGFRVRNMPPGNRDVFEALLSSGSVGLTDESCKNAGRDKNDSTVGAYLSGFLIDMDKPSGGNHLVIEQVSSAGDSWVVRAMLRHSEGEDIWSWGIEFAIRKKDGVVDHRSFHCIGAG